MIRLSLAELQALVKRTNNAHACVVIPGNKGWQEQAQQASDKALADGLRAIHLDTWADNLERQLKIVSGD